MTTYLSEHHIWRSKIIKPSWKTERSSVTTSYYWSLGSSAGVVSTPPSRCLSSWALQGPSHSHVCHRCCSEQIWATSRGADSNSSPQPQAEEQHQSAPGDGIVHQSRPGTGHVPGTSAAQRVFTCASAFSSSGQEARSLLLCRRHIID